MRHRDGRKLTKRQITKNGPKETVWGCPLMLSKSAQDNHKTNGRDADQIGKKGRTGVAV